MISREDSRTFDGFSFDENLWHTFRSRAFAKTNGQYPTLICELDFGVSGWTVNSGQRKDTVKTFGTSTRIFFSEKLTFICVEFHDDVFKL